MRPHFKNAVSQRALTIEPLFRLDRFPSAWRYKALVISIQAVLYMSRGLSEFSSHQQDVKLHVSPGSLDCQMLFIPTCVTDLGIQKRAVLKQLT